MARKTTRRSFCASLGLGSLPFLLSPKVSGQGGKATGPNILWLVSEDNGPFLGCYGDRFADTSHLDVFASEGILYENAFSSAPVCAPARSTIITGMYACSLGTHHMRSMNSIPSQFEFFTCYLRTAGYYCTNRAKEDYNTQKPECAWDESSTNATWRKRRPGQPFFSVINFDVSHESSLHKSTDTIHDPARVVLPPYHPDAPEFRHDWAQYYDRVTEMDRQIGEVLRELKAEGLADDTIVFYYADNGGVLPRSKRFLYDSGTHVPMIVRFPEKYRHLAPLPPGSRTDRLVSFVDLAPTVLSLAGIQIPGHMQGKAFLGAKIKPEGDYVYLFRGRMDERYDMMRAVRNKRFKYIRNYLPHRIYAQHLHYLWLMPAMQSWQRLYDEKKLSGPEWYFFREKPVEELYDIRRDPYEIDNLAGTPGYEDTLAEMRDAERAWVRNIHDPGFLQEGEMVLRSAGSTPYDMGHDAVKYDLESLLRAADIAGKRDPSAIPDLIGLMRNEDSGVRYWGAVGCRALGERASVAHKELSTLLHDPSPDVRIAAADALCTIETNQSAVDVLCEALEHENEYIRLHAANILDYCDEKVRYLSPLFREKMKSDSNYVQRVFEKALADLDT